MTTLTLHLHVQPGAARDEIAGMHGERIKVRITAPPVEGRANRHLVEFLAAQFGVPRKQVSLVRGETGRLKTVHIESPTRVPPALAGLLGDA